MQIFLVGGQEGNFKIILNVKGPRDTGFSDGLPRIVRVESE